MSIAPMFWKILPHRGPPYCGLGGDLPTDCLVADVWRFFWLERVETRQWGGLTLTLIIASVGIAGALPWGSYWR
ncbi:hypothetical protein ACLB1T_08455 [Escherichia coli]